MWQTRETNIPMDEPKRERSNGTESRDTWSTKRQKSSDTADKRERERASQEYAIAKARLTEKIANYRRELRQWEEN